MTITSLHESYNYILAHYLCMIDNDLGFLACIMIFRSIISDLKNTHDNFV